MFRKWFGKKENLEEPQPPAQGDEPLSTKASPKAAEGPQGPEAQAMEAPDSEEPKKARWSLFGRALEKTRKGLKSLFTFRRTLDEAFVEEIEAELFGADFGPETVRALLDGPNGIRQAWKDKTITEAEEVREFLKRNLKAMLTRREVKLAQAATPPTVILVAGVNGTGKTTSIAKLARRLRDDGKSVVLAAADTFRAAAVEQLTIWSQRLGVDIVTGKPQADPASVAYQGAETALATGVDYLIVDTAGRLHTQVNLMRELRKIRDVLSKKIPGSPHECLLVLDATTGQNALNQAKLFQAEVELSGIILAKLDGTAKGGIVVAINNQLDIPVKMIGVGEKLEDMEPFDVDKFVDAVFE